MPRARHPGLQAAVEVLAQEPVQLRTDTAADLLAFARAGKDDIWRWSLGHHNTSSHDPYDRAHSAADYWLAQWVQVVRHGLDSEQAVRAYGMVYFGGWAAGAGAMARGWRERLAQPGVPWTLGYVMDKDRAATLMCPYRYSQHGGASPGGGTFAAQYRKAWEYGVRFADAHLAGRRKRV